MSVPKAQYVGSSQTPSKAYRQESGPVAEALELLVFAADADDAAWQSLVSVPNAQYVGSSQTPSKAYRQESGPVAEALELLVFAADADDVALVSVPNASTLVHRMVIGILTRVWSGAALFDDGLEYRSWLAGCNRLYPSLWHNR